MIIVEREECVCCGWCQVDCPVHAITLAHGTAFIDQSKCIQCKICICKCLTRAIVEVEDETAS